VYVATDGSGDYNCDGVDDQVEINRAINYIDSMGGGTVHLKSGTYIIDAFDSPIIMKSHITLEGENRSSTIVKLADNIAEPDDPVKGFYMIYGGQITNIIIQDIQLDANKRNNPTHIPHWGVRTRCIRVESDQSTYRNILLRDFSHDGIILHGHVGGLRNDIIGCRAELVGHDAIVVDGNTDSNIIDFVSGENGNNLIRLRNSQHCTLDNIRGPGGDNAIQLQTMGSGQCNYNTIKNSILTTDVGSAENAIVLNQDDSGSLTGNKIINTIIYNTDWDGIRINGADNTEIENCVIYKSGHRTGSGSGIKVSRGAGTTVKNSIISNCGEYGIDGDAISQYNDMWSNADGNYRGTSAGTGDISVDPLLEDPENRDFHLKSQAGRWTESRWVTDSETSPCIDAGDPASEYSNELDPNGGRINMGTYGNTKYASMTPGGHTGIISGMVTDADTNAGIQGASVSAGTLSATSGSDGSYTIEDAPVGNCFLTCVKTGYNPATQTVTVSENTTATADFQLTQATDIIAIWHFDKGSETTAEDSSGNENHGIISGATWTTGLLGSALEFDGTDDYIEVANSASLDSITDEITLIAWVKTPVSERHTILDRWLYDTGVDERSFELDISSDGKISFGLSVDGSSSAWLESAGTVTADVWTHVAATSNGTTMRIYINGQADMNTASAPSGIYAAAANLHIGRWWCEGTWSDAFDGVIDEAKIFKRALIPEEIEADFKAGDTTPPVVTLKTIKVSGSVNDATVTQVNINGTTVTVTAGAYSHEVDIASTDTITVIASNGDNKTVTRTITIK
jgi:hypothetical protein